jgi:hypothetical protein
MPTEASTRGRIGRPRISPSKKKLGRLLKCPCCEKVFYHNLKNTLTIPSKEEKASFRKAEKDYGADKSKDHSES